MIDEMGMDVRLLRPIPEEFRAELAGVYEQAFGPKFSGAVWRKEDRIKLIETAIQLDCGYVAVSGKGTSATQFLGVVGFEHEGRSLTGGIGFKGLVKQLGWVKGAWAAAVFSLFERKPVPSQFVMDGIAVVENARGKGVGTKLLQKVIDFATTEGYETVRLDVIGDNKGARRLYERTGFEEVKSESFPYLKWLIGFSSSTEMVYRISKETAKVE